MNVCWANFASSEGSSTYPKKCRITSSSSTKYLTFELPPLEMTIEPLTALQARLKAISETITNLEAERSRVREEITRERARLRLEQERADHAMAPQVVS